MHLSVLSCEILHTGRVMRGAGVAASRLAELSPKVLGYAPFPGTLNVRLDHPLPPYPPPAVTAHLAGYTVSFWPCTVNGLPGHILAWHATPDRRDIEIVSAHRLRPHGPTIDLDR